MSNENRKRCQDRIHGHAHRYMRIEWILGFPGHSDRIFWKSNQRSEKSGKKTATKSKEKHLKKGVVNLSNVTDVERWLEAPSGFGSKGGVHTFENHFRRRGGKEAESKLWMIMCNSEVIKTNWHINLGCICFAIVYPFFKSLSCLGPILPLSNLVHIHSEQSTFDGEWKNRHKKVTRTGVLK